MKQEIKKRWTGDVMFVAEIDCADDAPLSLRLGLSVKWGRTNKANLSGASLSWADLSGADLSGANLSGASLSRASLSGASLSRADLSGANLSGASLSGASLSGASLSGADLSWASLSGAHLSGADLSGADLSGASLSGADLSGADLSGAHLSWADLIDGGQRADGYRFIGQARDGVLWIQAGCRYFPISEAREHWERTRGNTPLGAETMSRLDAIQAIAVARGLITDTEGTE